MLGHASAAMTLDVYSGLFTDDLDRVGEQLHEAAMTARSDAVRFRSAEVVSLPIVRLLAGGAD
ncbi:MAG: hypothetical protein ACR2J5_07920 [Geodermatophilaceae bacterium]